MKNLITILMIVFAIGDASSQDKPTQDSITSEIRRLEFAQAEAVRTGDLAILNDLFLPDYAVNAPINKVARKAEVLQRIREGLIRYSSFEFEIESIVVHGNVVITMGRESVKPLGDTPMAGQTVLRRYSHVWLREGLGWRQIARHANIICAESH